MHALQGPRVGSAPEIAKHRHLLAIGQPETRDVDSPTTPMFRNPRTGPVIAGAANVMRRNIYLHHPATPATHRRAHLLTYPAVKRARGVAVQRRHP